MTEAEKKAVDKIVADYEPKFDEYAERMINLIARILLQLKRDGIYGPEVNNYARESINRTMNKCFDKI